MLKALSLAGSLLFLSVSHLALADSQPTPLRGLLNEVKNFSATDNAKMRERERLFAADLTKQQALLSQSRQRLQQADAQQAQLKQAFDQNDQTLADLETQLQSRTGQLGEVFGVARQVASELQPLLQDSMISAAHPQRAATLDFSQSKRVPTTEELQTLWYQLLQEMTESGQISRFNSQIITPDGQTESSTVVRVGPFTAITDDGRFLNWNVARQALTVLPVQPGRSEQRQAADYVAGASDTLLIDPSRGQLLELLGRIPTLKERLQQGGWVGYLIMFLGGCGLLVAFWQLAHMLLLEVRIRRQLKQPEHASTRNPLGRILDAAQHASGSLEQVELKVDEAVLHELPKMERGQNFIKLLAAIAPLLGLLGTVVGMIATFQSITLFGTSDPKLMAGGISQALMTTVLGLVVAVPLLFSHSLLSTRSRRLGQLLQEKSLAAIFQHSRQNVAAQVNQHGA